MKIAIGCDHAGLTYKAGIKRYLEEKGYEFKDFGCEPGESVDYPDYGRAVGEAVVTGEFDRGIVVCGTGIGISIAANKVRGVRAALCGDCFSAKASREHNDANVLALGERAIGLGHALIIVDTWLHTEFEGGRHARRVDKIAEIEKDYNR